MKFIIYCIFCVLFISCSISENKKGEKKFVILDKIRMKNYNPKPEILTLKSYCKKKAYNEQYGIIINFSIHSGNSATGLRFYKNRTAEHLSLLQTKRRRSVEFQEI